MDASQQESCELSVLSMCRRVTGAFRGLDGVRVRGEGVILHLPKRGKGILEIKVIVASIPKSSGFPTAGRASHSGKPTGIPRESRE